MLIGLLVEEYTNQLKKSCITRFSFVANTHTETSTTGATMSLALDEAMQIIKDHVGANDDDVLISAGAGMTMLVNKLQRILGLKLHESYVGKIKITNRPIVFIRYGAPF